MSPEKIDHAATAARYEQNAVEDLDLLKGTMSGKEAAILATRAQAFATLAQSHRLAAQADVDRAIAEMERELRSAEESTKVPRVQGTEEKALRQGRAGGLRAALEIIRGQR